MLLNYHSVQISHLRQSNKRAIKADKINIFAAANQLFASSFQFWTQVFLHLFWQVINFNQGLTFFYSGETSVFTVLQASDMKEKIIIGQKNVTLFFCFLQRFDSCAINVSQCLLCLLNFLKWFGYFHFFTCQFINEMLESQMFRDCRYVQHVCSWVAQIVELLSGLFSSCFLISPLFCLFRTLSEWTNRPVVLYIGTFDHFSKEI